MADYWDPDIAKMELSAVEKNGMQFYRNFSTAIESKRIEKLVERFNENQPLLEDFTKVATLIAQEQPLSLSVIACAYADELLKQMFKREIPSSVPGGRNELLNGFGPLSRLSQRIQIAYAFGWLSPDILGELDLLRRIRNDISHKWDLEQLQVKLRELAELKQHPIEEHLGDGAHFPEGFHASLSVLAKFRVRVLWILGRLFYESHYFVPAVRLRLDPQSVLYSSKPPALLGSMASICIEQTRTVVARDAG
jgi:hypothetical protein